MIGPDDDKAAMWVSVAQDPEGFEPTSWHPEPSVLSLERIDPLPETPPESDDIMPDWWHWRIEHWGTKWDVHAEFVSPDRIQFDSAWSPPETAIRTLARRWPTLTFCLTYDEPGMDFGGFVVVRGDEVLDDRQGQSRATTWHDEGDYRLEDIDWEMKRAVES